MLTPLYRALLEASLSWDGLLEPSVSADGRFFESGRDLLEDELGLAFILQALVRADAAIGATVGKEVLQSLAESVGIEGGVDARYNKLRCDGHFCSDVTFENVVHDAGRFLADQLGN
jgi:hypothetical protein